MRAVTCVRLYYRTKGMEVDNVHKNGREDRVMFFAAVKRNYIENPNAYILEHLWSKVCFKLARNMTCTCLTPGSLYQQLYREQLAP